MVRACDRALEALEAALTEAGVELPALEGEEDGSEPATGG
jgi:hypothetical protein